MTSYTFFYSKSDVLSQWYPCKFTIDNITFTCAEQWMMYSKALLFKDKITRQKILSTHDPSKQKALGRIVKNFDPDVWSKESKVIVYVGNLAKFTQNKELLDQLLSTEYTTLVEASPSDLIWGIGLRASDKRATNKELWRGKNLLGSILTMLRDNLINNDMEIPYDKLYEL